MTSLALSVGVVLRLIIPAVSHSCESAESKEFLIKYKHVSAA